jgi:DNA-binding transcriptional ArsR family regulator
MMSHEDETIDDILRDIEESDKIVDEAIAALKKMELESAFDDGRREGRKLGFKYAITILKDRLKFMEELIDEYKTEGWDLRRSDLPRKISIYKEIIEGLEELRINDSPSGLNMRAEEND